MLGKLLIHESRFLLRNLLFWLLSVIFLGLGFITGSQNNAPPNIFLNSSYQVSYNTGIFTLGAIFIIMFMAASALLRDQKYGMQPIVLSTTVQKRHYLLSKFIAVFITSVLAFSPFFIGHILGIVLSPHDPSRIMPVSAVTYLVPWVYIAGFNVFICSALISSVTLITRNHLATYVSAIAIYALYFLCAIFLNSPVMADQVPATPTQLSMAALGDPFGISAFFKQTQFWTPYEKNYHSLSFSGIFLWNRLLWLAFSSALLYISFRYFTLTPKLVKGGKKVTPSKAYTGIYGTVPTSNGGRSKLLAFISQARSDLRGMIRDLPFLAMFLIWLLIVFTEIYSRMYEGGSYGESRYPETFILLELMTDPLRYFCLLPIIFYSGELVWREQQFNFRPIAYATQAGSMVFFMSKLCVLLLIPVLFIFSGSLIAIGFQLYGGQAPIEGMKYLSTFYYHGMPLYFFCLLALFLQVLIGRKFLAMIITLICMVLTRSYGALGVEHPLLRLGYMPYIEYSGMGRTLPSGSLFNDLALVLAGISLLLLLTTLLFWRKNRSRIIHRPSRVRPTVVVLAFSILFTLIAAAKVYYHQNIKSTYVTSKENLDLREKYERTYKKYSDLPILYPDSIHIELDIRPHERSYSVKAGYRLKNRSDRPADSVLVSARLPLLSIRLQNADLLFHDPEQDVYMFHFRKPVMPGHHVNYSYSLEHRPGRYETDNSIVDNGTYIMQQQFEPHIGYRTGMEITDNYERSLRGMPPINMEKRDEHLEWRNEVAGLVNFTALVSTAEDQVALTSGQGKKKWKEHSRNFYLYQSTEAFLPAVAYFSAAYDSISGNHGNLRIEQYFHPEHAYNIDSIQKFIIRTLDYCTKEFGPYPFDELRIAEVPSYWRFGGFAHPGLISMVENNLHLVNTGNNNDFNLVAKRTIHEVAHQWWGHKLTPAMTKGGSFLVEGLAKYSEAAIMEKYYGKGALFSLGRNATSTYFTGRTMDSEREPPLTSLDGQGYLSYGKSYLVMAGLRDLIGDDTINEALRSLINRQQGRNITIEDFLKLILIKTPERYHETINDWFNKVIRYELSVKTISSDQLADSTWEIRISVNANRFETKADGSEISIGIDEDIPISMLLVHPSQVKSDFDILSYQLMRIDSTNKTIILQVDKRPKYIAIDPFGSRTDNDLFDNTRAIDE